MREEEEEEEEEDTKSKGAEEGTKGIKREQTPGGATAAPASPEGAGEAARKTDGRPRG